MDIKSEIKKYLDSNAISQISSQADTSTSETKSVIDSALPMILGGLAKESDQQALGNTLDQKHDGSILDNIVEAITNSNTQTDGNKILGHIFGNQDQQVAQVVSKKTGVDSAKIMMILAILAPIVLGKLGKTKSDNKLDSGGLMDILKNQKIGKSDSSILGSILDKNKDGSVLDDLINIGGNLLRKK